MSDGRLALVFDDGHVTAEQLGELADAAWETVPSGRVAAVVDAARGRDIEVTTVRDAV